MNQGGTLGAVLAKANKLAAAASTDASLNQMLPPSHGIEMRLSVQNSEQVANLSKEISRLQNLVSPGIVSFLQSYQRWYLSQY